MSGYGQKGFFGALFDFSFSEFITTKVIKILYGIFILLGGLFALGMVIAGFTQGGGAGFFALIVAPLIFLVQVIGARIWLELVMVIFRIADHVAAIAGTKGAMPPPPPVPPAA